MIPTWTYVKAKGAIYVNLFLGSTVNVDKVAGTDVQMVQKTDYPWSGKVSITVNPKTSAQFSVFVRVPNRTTSELYKSTPEVSGLKSLSLNGKPLTPRLTNGYTVISRTWKNGDTIDLELPMAVQRIKADEKIVADQGRTALRYGPLIYNIERADQPDIEKILGPSPLSAQWRADLLQGVVAIKGSWSDGSSLLAIPHYARNNRESQAATADSAGAGDPAIDYSGGATTGTTTNAASAAPATPRPRRFGDSASMVWIKDQ
jgi:DUF1680 family protein